MSALPKPVEIQSLEGALAVTSAAIQRAAEPGDNSNLFPRLASKIGPGKRVVHHDLALNHWLFLNSPYRYHWLCGGIGTGKSYVLARYALRRVLENWETIGLLAGNTYQQLSQSTLPHLFKLLEDAGFKKGKRYVVDRKPPASWKARNLFEKGYENVISIKVARGKVAHILTRTLESWKAIRGVTLGWAGIDEIADTRFEAWEEINERLRCSLSHLLQIMVVGMPALPGDNWTWEEFSTGDPELYRVTFMASTEALHLSWDNYILPLLKRLDPLKALQRIFARIVIDQTGRVYYSYRDGINNQDKYEYDPDRPLYLHMDFNILSASPIAGCLHQEFDNGQGDWDVQVLDEIVIPGQTTLELLYEFLKRYGQHRSEVHVYGDASGGLNRTISEFQHVRDVLTPHFAGRLFVWDQNKSNPRISERVAAVNALLRNALGIARLFVSLKCVHLIRDFRKLLPKDGKIDKSDPELSHVSDGLGYGLWFRFPPFETVPSRRVIEAEF